MKKIIALLSLLAATSSFAYYVSDAARTCSELAKAEVQAILDYEREMQNGSQVNYIVRGPENEVQMTNDPHEWVKVKVSITTYTLDDDQYELNETYIFDGEYDPVGGVCYLGEEPNYEGHYCGETGEVSCLK